MKFFLVNHQESMRLFLNKGADSKKLKIKD